MIKLTDLLGEETFTAINKATGKVSVFKSKDSRDAAVKAGTHDEKEEAEKGGDSAGEKEKPNMFSKDAGYDAPDTKDEPKSEPIEVDVEEIEDFTDVDDLIAKNKDKLSKQQIDKLTQLSADWEDAEGEMMMGGDDEADAEYQRTISSIKADIEDVISKSEPAKDSTQQRAGNPEVNKKVRATAKKLGITPAKLGKDEYKLKMSQAAVEALTDANFHSEARALISKLEGKPEWAEKPTDMPDISSPEYDEWRKNSVYSSKYYDADDSVMDLGTTASQEAGWDGRDALDSIAFDLKMNGFKDLASTLQSVIKENKSTKLTDLI